MSVALTLQILLPQRYCSFRSRCQIGFGGVGSLLNCRELHLRGYHMIGCKALSNEREDQSGKL